MSSTPSIISDQGYIRLGFIPLLDAAPIILGLEQGFFREEGVSVSLHRQPSWSSLRDRLSVGMLEGAQMLGPMALAINLGLGAPAVRLVAPMVLSRNGNAISVRRALHDELMATGFDLSQPGESARALAAVVNDRARPIRVGVVYAWSSHYLQLRDWLATAGLGPSGRIELVTVPPQEVLTALASGSVDVACVGEPWNSLAEYHGVSHILVSGSQIWQNAPEKVLGLREDWVRSNPETLHRLLRAVIRSCRWLDEPANRERILEVLARPEYLGDAMLPLSESGQSLFHPRIQQHFFRQTASFPWLSQAEWLLFRMEAWGQREEAAAPPNLETVFRPDLYRGAAAALGLDSPLMNYKPEGQHNHPFRVAGHRGAIEVASDRLLGAD